MALRQGALPLKCLNHVSLVCKDLDKSVAFYRDLLGFEEVRRPQSFDFEGSWLFGCGVGIHLIRGDQSSQVVERPSAINPKADHLSFQVGGRGDGVGRASRLGSGVSVPRVPPRGAGGGTSVPSLLIGVPAAAQSDHLEAVVALLEALGMHYERQRVREGTIVVSQVFLHDPDHNMIEICNCDCLPVVPLGASPWLQRGPGHAAGLGGCAATASAADRFCVDARSGFGADMGE
ncbi:unnamed protein product [Ostreobium quekettii]|uniref:VOC domain-containing protein n=1 Tax=Ostreobium quekettii TaxID=121088 RepID=A0A8S1JCD0_9CHLO|nr:unnamed protein product [Ostreobium quekettii]|eukprot:evm.model.scf_1221.3 EVM.evm.TU.scf_1221.3   scf_1221:30618-32163(+)